MVKIMIQNANDRNDYNKEIQVCTYMDKPYLS
jgi:hypothetical protein